MIVHSVDELRDGERHVKSKGWDSIRLLLKKDGMGFSYHVTRLYAGETLEFHYRNHLEAVLVIEGSGTLEDLATGQVHVLRPGVMYALNEHDHHRVRPTTDIVCVCVFNPPVTGAEVHDETGAYPAEHECVKAE
ncbi:MAG: ectoine synthase [Rhodocyclales bacterium]|nr:ectoine synthase [Rhodocyclales bacterium]